VTSDSLEHITVVAAVIEDNGRFLVTRRPAGVHLGGLWEFPGGKTSDGESHSAGLLREIREELAADVDVHELIHATTHQYSDRVVSLHFYRCTLAHAPSAALGQEMRWVDARELHALEFPPADVELIRLLTADGRSSA
jgi:mutator protein MutT